MDFQSWIQNLGGLAGIYSFDIMPDGSYSEIRLTAFNKQNEAMTHMTPDAPEFYPGIPYRSYWMDINFEDMVYKCGSTGEPQYSYVNARGFWLKGHYIPVSEPGTVSAEVFASQNADSVRTIHVLYIVTYSPQVEVDSMTQKSPEVASAAVSIGLKMHESEDFYQAMSEVVKEIKRICGSERCSVYTVNRDNQKCAFINDQGLQKDFLDKFASEMQRTPFEVAMAWEKDLDLSDCLILDDLSVVEERDPVWYKSLCVHDIRNIILYAVKNGQTLVGFIWAANYDVSKKEMIKETMELTSFLIAAVIANHQFVSRLEEKSTTDGLTQVGNRNAMNDRVDRFISSEVKLPEKMGVAFMDLNGLKTINDDEGHDAGDRLLTRAAALLKIAFGDYEIYRAGGDEFIAFCPDITEEKLEQQASQLRALADNTADVSFAIGTVYCTGEYDICRAMQQADERMYKDKEEYYRNHPEKDRRRRDRG